MNTAVFESVRRSLAYIEAHLSEDIGVRDVADSVSYSQFYFSREFARYTHQTVYDYMMKRKISESYKRLFQEKLRIADLAFQYGFQSHEVYTRAFKKVFNELPSEAAIYKPLAVFEAIDDRYLAFLCGLRAERIHTPVPDCFFRVAKPAAASDPAASALIQLSDANPFEIERIFEGDLSSESSKRLAFRLTGLETVLRIHAADPSFSLRYFTEHAFNPSGLAANYILLKRGNQYVDILAPLAPRP